MKRVGDFFCVKEMLKDSDCLHISIILVTFAVGITEELQNPVDEQLVALSWVLYNLGVRFGLNS